MELQTDKQIILRKNEEHRVLAGHPWVFSNEIREIVGSPAAGDIVRLVRSSGTTLGIGFYHPHSLIAFRLLSPNPETIDAEFFVRRFSRALELRSMLFPGSTVYRLVHSEADDLPGLIVDRYNGYVVLQTLSAGMEMRLPMICDALESVLHPDAILERNESPLRTLEQLPQRKGVLRGTPARITIEEHGLRYAVDLLEGQKTGFFLDQRENRALAARYCAHGSVLDCFCNDGGFALNAARGGAESVLGLDISADAVQRAGANAALNGISNVQFQQVDVFEALGAAAGRGERFDSIILDPPSFTRSKKNVQPAKKGYRDLHMKAFALLRRGGILLTASCSHHIESGVFLDIIEESARKCGRKLQLLDWRGASPDHPTIPAIPETRYLKFGVFRVG